MIDAEAALLLLGLVMTVVGVVLAKKTSSAAHRGGIGAFRLFPLAGIAHLTGLLMVMMGIFMALLGIAALRS